MIELMCERSACLHVIRQSRQHAHSYTLGWEWHMARMAAPSRWVCAARWSARRCGCVGRDAGLRRHDTAGELRRAHRAGRAPEGRPTQAARRWHLHADPARARRQPGHVGGAHQSLYPQHRAPGDEQPARQPSRVAGGGVRHRLQQRMPEQHSPSVTYGRLRQCAARLWVYPLGVPRRWTSGGRFGGVGVRLLLRLRVAVVLGQRACRPAYAVPACRD